MPSDTTPLPVAPDRAAISNRIALLLNKQSSILKTLNPSKPSDQSRRPKAQPTHHDRDPDEDLFNGPRPNEGVGYERPKEGPSAGDKSKEDMTLRRRLMGRKEGANALAQRQAKKQPESESDDDAGRSALGKRKRPKRTATEVDDTSAQVHPAAQGGIDPVDREVESESTAKVDALQEATSSTKKKNKKKKKTKGTEAKQ